MIWILLPFAMLLTVALLIPILPMPYGFVRAFDFPRMQLAIASSVLLLLSLWFLAFDALGIITTGLFALTALAQASYILRFTRIWWRRSADFDGNSRSMPSIQLLVSNVKMGNRDYGKLQTLIEDRSPDIALFMEVDQEWAEALDDATEDYGHRLSAPQDNTYGMHLVSKIPFSNAEIKRLLNDDVPSFDITFRHDEDETFRLIAIHPEPPVPGHDTVGRDAEIALVGEEVRDYEDALIVTGDLNDVAWSRTTRRFMRISRLLDPREGRGLFNTFDARYFFLRWPLDHIFHSPHFQFINIARMPFVGSDHFPMLFELALTNKEKGRRPAKEASDEDFDEANDVVRREKKRDERPVGADWEEEK